MNILSWSRTVMSQTSTEFKNVDRPWVGSIMRAVGSVLVLLAMSFVAVLPPVTAQEGAAPWRISEDAGDVSPMEPNAAGVPANPTVSHADLVALEIDQEDEAGLRVSILVDELVVRWVADCCQSRTAYVVSFKLGSSPVEYKLRFSLWSSDLPAADAGSIYAVASWWGYFCVNAPGDWCTLEQRADLTLDDAGNAIRFWIPKESLLGQSPDEDRGFIIRGGDEPQPPPGLPPVLKAGDRLTEFRVESSYYLTRGSVCAVAACLPVFPPPATLEDAMPDGGPADESYAFTHGSANGPVRLRLTGADSDGDLPVLNGLNQSVRFELKNTQAAKRLVKLEYKLDGPEAALGRYAVFGPSTISIPAETERNLTLALNVSGDAADEDDVRLIVRGTTVGHPEELAYAAARLIPSPTLTPEANILYLHARSVSRTPVAPLDTVVCRLPEFFLGYEEPCRTGFISPRKDEEGTDPTGRIGGFQFPEDEELHLGYLMPALRSLPAPVALDPAKPIEIDVQLVAEIPTDGLTFQAFLFNDDDFETLFEAKAEGSVGPAPTTIQFHGTPQVAEGETSVIPAGTGLVFGFLVSSSLSPTGGASWAAKGIEIVAPASQIRMPVRELPPEYQIKAVPGLFQLQPLGSVEDHVNPGESVAFNVTLLNQGTTEGVVDLSTTLDAPPGWSARVVPGNAFKLAPGEAFQVGVLVAAPRDANEGDLVGVWLNATSRESGSVASLRFNAIAVGGVDQPDAGASYAVDPEAQGHLVVPDGKGTPGPELVAALGVAALVGAWMRRRRVR